MAKTSFKPSGPNKQNGAISYINLTIRPQSSNVLIAEITQSGYTKVHQKQYDVQHSNLNEGLSEFSDIPLNKPFKIYLRNGAIHSLSVDSTMTNDQINALKGVVSQFQVDTKAQNVMDSDDNHLPERNGNAFYKTMEPTSYGECETIYNITALPEHLKQSNKWVSLPDLAGKGELIQVVKTKNYENCNERNRHLSNLIGQKDNTVMVSQNSRIIISGSLTDYTIQSAVITNKVENLEEYIYLTLKSVEQSNNNYENNLQYGNRLKEENLLYNEDLQKYGGLEDSKYNFYN